jgi:hypothetical protein
LPDEIKACRMGQIKTFINMNKKPGILPILQANKNYLCVRLR